MSRFSSALVLVVLVAPAAAASPKLSAFPAALPSRCVPLARVPRATIATPNIAAHVSVANCLAESAMNTLKVTPDSASIAALDTATKPSIAMFDEVIALHDPYWTAIAEDAKRDLFEGMIVRERASTLLPDLTLEASLQPWRERADEAREVVAKVMHDNPSLASRDAVIASIVKTEKTDSRVAHAQ